jgi:hypothetical protein
MTFCEFFRLNIRMSIHIENNRLIASNDVRCALNFKIIRLAHTLFAFEAPAVGWHGIWYVRIYIYIYIYVCIYICIYIYVYVCVCVCGRTHD